nr:PAS domain-containing protein [uncultured Desulfobulbus sp.]
MPQSARATGVADLVLPTSKIPEKILEITRHSTFLASRKATEPGQRLTDHLRTIFQIVNAQTSHDFSAYKVSTIMRRIERRMAVNEILDIPNYIQLLKEKPEESKALFKEFLIGVTSFFRDPEAFEAIKRQVLPLICKDRDPNEPLRVWLAGCATGEEAYSLTMLIQEYLRATRLDVKVQIFASDIDCEAMNIARNGIYPDCIGADVTPERLRTFFQKTDNSYQIASSLREMIVFAQHNVIKDPPFSRLDVLVCRNLLIYLNPDLQKRVLPLFAQALKPNGFLFLGTSETVGGFTDLFSTVDKKWKIFQRRVTSGKIGVEFPLAKLAPHLPVTEPVRIYPEARGSSPGMLAEKTLIQRYSPPCVVVNVKFEIVYFSTRTSRYLEPPVGEPTQNILKMAKPDLRPALRAAIHKALTEQEMASYQGLRIRTDSGEERLNLQVEPITSPPSAKGLALVIFEPSSQEAAPSAEVGGEITVFDKNDGVDKDILVKQLEEQLRITNEQLQTTVERMETANEELKSSNEELMSMNEEFQSTNEELETSKEELQALNEELVTVNAELQNKVDELGQANSDLQNFLASSDIATIFLDRQFRVKRFSPAMAKLFNLLISDIGRPLQHFKGAVNYAQLQEDAEQVLQNLTPVEREISDPQQDTFFLVRILPYRSLEDVIDGVVVTFVDITNSKRWEAERQRERNLLKTIMQTTDVMLVYLDANFNFIMVNQAYADTCGMEPEAMVGKNHFALYPNPENEAIFKQVRDTGEAVFYKDKAFTFPDQPDRGTTYWDWSLSPVQGSGDTTVGLVFSLRETTQYKLMEQALRESEDRFRAFMDNNPAIAWMKDAQGHVIYLNKSYEQEFNVKFQDWEGKTDAELWPKQTAEQFRRDDLAVLETGTPCERIEEVPAADGQVQSWWTFKFPFTDAAQRQYVAGIGINISDRLAAEKALVENENMVRTIIDSVDDGFIVIDPHYQIVTANKPFCHQVGLAKDKVIGQTCHQIIRGLDTPCFTNNQECTTQTVFKTGSPQYSSHTRLNADGKKLYIEIKAYPLKKEDGTVYAVIEAIRDVTEKRFIEDERLKNQKLHSIGTLAGGISHDFNNLLQMIFGYINFAKESFDEKETALSYLHKAEGAMEQAVSLTRQLHTFSKGGDPVKRNLSLVSAIEEGAQFALSGSGVDYQLETAPELWMVNGDKGQLVQVFQNLILNAREAINEVGNIRISIENDTLEPGAIPGLSEGGRFLRVVIQDFGSGIPENILTQIYDPYFTTKSTGIGLGLAIVFSIVKRHGGAILADSMEKMGTTFTLYFPAVAAEEEQKQVALPQAVSDKNARILFMDDEEMVCDIASRMLTVAGHEVVCTTNGEETIQQYIIAHESGAPYDLVILDLTIKGGMGGEETIKELVNIDPNVVAIVSSGYGDNDVVAHYEQYGFQGILNKPYRKVELLNCVGKLLG